MQANEDLYIKIAGIVGGDDATGVVAALVALKAATDEQISNHANLRISSVRRTLYKLLSLGLVRYEEKRDEQTQRIVFVWSPAVDQLEGFVNNMKRVISEKIKVKIDYLRSHVFFYCGNQAHPKLTFEEAVESFYRCPICGNPLHQVDVSDLIEKFEKRLTLLQGDVLELSKTQEKKAAYPTEEEAEKLLRELNAPEELIAHCKKVTEVSKKLVQKLKERRIHINEQLVIAGAMLHDVGRVKTHGVEHGVVGANLLREKGFPEELASIAERHVGGGLSKTEAKKLVGVEVDLAPRTLEEKLVCYADKLVDRDKEVPFEETLNYYKSKFGSNHLSVRRLIKLDKEIKSFLGERKKVEKQPAPVESKSKATEQKKR
ncbi:MAG: HDIG domain-containing metalloprotein [Thermoproteota archaeon]